MRLAVARSTWFVPMQKHPTHENTDRFWKRSFTHSPRGNTPDRKWAGRWDDKQAVLGVDKNVVIRVLLGAGFADPMAVLESWHQQGLLETDSRGAPRWQARVGGHGRRQWLLGIRRSVLAEAVTVGSISIAAST